MIGKLTGTIDSAGDDWAMIDVFALALVIVVNRIGSDASVTPRRTWMLISPGERRSAAASAGSASPNRPVASRTSASPLCARGALAWADM